MAQWKPAKNETDLRVRITRQLRRRRIPAVIWANAIRLEYVEEALDRGRGRERSTIRMAEAALGGFVAGQLSQLRRRVLGYRMPRRPEPAARVIVRPGHPLMIAGNGVGFDYTWYDEYTKTRIEAEPDGVDFPVDFKLGKLEGKLAVIISARPWVPPAVVARVYAAVTRNFPDDVHGPHLRRLKLFNFVLQRRLYERRGETWADTMAAWNTAVTEGQVKPGTKYAHVSNFCRDFYDTAEKLGWRKYLKWPRKGSTARRKNQH